LEECKLINRVVYKEIPPKVEYSVTKIGKTLSPILDELGEWGIEYNQNFEYGNIDFEDDYEE
jgi:DNA-binding HxlR family transcriptional regulator